MSYTPGPWNYGEDQRGRKKVFAPDHREVVRAMSARPERVANARLIAAAPELLEALKELLPEGWGDDDTMDHMPGVKRARYAIAKAESRAL